MKKIIILIILSVALISTLGFFGFKHFLTTEKKAKEKTAEPALNLDDPKIEQKLRERESRIEKTLEETAPPTAEVTPPANISIKPTASAGIKVPILTYHSIRPFFPGEPTSITMYIVPPEIFSQQLEYLKKEKYNTVSFADLKNYFDTGAPLPEKPIIISLDDGWKSQYDYAFPLLKKESFKATFFVFTNAIGKKHFLSWSEIKEMAAAGMEIGGHTKSHPYLFKITDEKILRQEIIDGKKTLERELGQGVTAFAYPFGRYNNLDIKIVKEAGYQTARSGYGGAYHTKADLYTLRSLQVPNDFNEFVKKISKY